MKSAQLLLAGFGIGLMLTACQKDQHLIQGSTPHSSLKSDTAEEIDAFFDANRSSNFQSFSVNAQSGGTFTTTNGTALTITPNAFRNLDGSDVNGNVSIRILENYLRSDMLLNNMVTESMPDASGTGSLPIKTGGSYIIEMQNDQGQEVVAVSGGFTISAPGENTGGINPSMTLWTGMDSPSQARDIAWQNTNATPAMTNTTYEVPVTVSERINIDSWEDWLNWMNGTIFLRVTLPSGFDNGNTEVFYTMNNERQSLGSLDRFIDGNNTSANSWTENNAYFSPGQSGNIVVVSTAGGMLRSQIVPFTIQNNTTIVQVNNLTETTTAELAATVNNLP